MLLSGALAALGGAALLIGQSSPLRVTTSGRGFISLPRSSSANGGPANAARMPVLRIHRSYYHQVRGVVKLPSGDPLPVQFIQMVPCVLTMIVWLASSATPGRRGRSANLTRRNGERDSARTGRAPQPVRSTGDDSRRRGVGQIGRVASSLGMPSIPYGDIPNWPDANVVGHEGRLVIGEIAGRCVAAPRPRPLPEGATSEL